MTSGCGFSFLYCIGCAGRGKRRGDRVRSNHDASARHGRRRLVLHGLGRRNDCALAIGCGLEAIYPNNVLDIHLLAEGVWGADLLPIHDEAT